MIKRNLNDLLSFVAVAREGTFTRAAAQLGVTQSALSQSISGLEARLQIRLLTRTTRSVSPTAAGERLLNAIGNRFDEIEAELDELSALRDDQVARFALPVAITSSEPCCYPGSPRCCWNIQTSRWSSTSTMAFGTSWPTGSMPAYAWATP